MDVCALCRVQQLGPVLSAAACIVAAAFAGMLTTTNTYLIEFGFILVVGALLDACVVRIMLVPALLSFGDRLNWWPGDACDAWWLRVRGYAVPAVTNLTENTESASPAGSPAMGKRRSVTDAAANYWAARNSITGTLDLPAARVSLMGAQVRDDV